MNNVITIADNEIINISIKNNYKSLLLELNSNNYQIPEYIEERFEIIETTNEDCGTYSLEIKAKFDYMYIFTPADVDTFKFMNFNLLNNKNIIYIFDQKTEDYYIYKNKSFIVTNNFEKKSTATCEESLNYYFDEEFKEFNSENSIIKALINNYLFKILKKIFFFGDNRKFYICNNMKTEIVDIDDFCSLEIKKIKNFIQILYRIEETILNSKHKEENIKFIKYFLTIGKKEEICLPELLKIIDINFSKIKTYITDYQNGELEKFLDKRRDFQKTFIDFHQNFLKLKNSLQDKITNLTFLVIGSFSTLLFFILKTESYFFGVISLVLFFSILYIFLKFIYFKQINISKTEIIEFYNEISKEFRCFFQDEELKFYDEKKEKYNKNINDYMKLILRMLKVILFIFSVILLYIILMKIFDIFL